MLLAVMMVLLAACGASSSNDNQNEAVNNGPATTNAVNEEKATVYPLTLKDATDTELVFDTAPTKVVTLVPSETEVMFAIGAGDVVVAVDENSNYPSEAAALPKIGNMTTNIEAVTALNPDLVVASSSMNSEAIEQLRALKIKVYASEPKTYDAVIAKVETMGQIMDKQGEAAKVAEHMKSVQQQVNDAVKDAPKRKVYLEFSPGWTVGSGEFLDELLTMAGGVNIAGSKPGWFEVTPEEVIAQNPEVILYPNMKADPNPIEEGILSRPGWSVIAAVKNKQMFALTEDPLVRVGPRLADGLLEMAKAIHPDYIK